MTAIVSDSLEGEIDTMTTRRQVMKGTAAIAAGVFASGRFAALAQDAAAEPPLVSLRVRTLRSIDLVHEVNPQVIHTFIPQVKALPGYGGYILGDVIDQPQSLAISVVDNREHLEDLREVSRIFVAGLDEKFAQETPKEYLGPLSMKASPAGTEGTPQPSGPLTTGYIAVRNHTSLPGTDPMDFVPEAEEGFLPIVTAIEGFLGYLWFPHDVGFTAISLYTSPESAQASTDAAMSWATEKLAKYTDMNPEVINATLVYADLPVLAAE
jgi:hypothetical protein